MPKSLKQLRDEAGLTLEEAVAKVVAIEPSAPASKVGFWHIEKNGTDRLRIIHAIADAYALPRAVVEESAMSMLHKSQLFLDNLLQKM
jgi:hypothetical protein